MGGAECSLAEGPPVARRLRQSPAGGGERAFPRSSSKRLGRDRLPGCRPEGSRPVIEMGVEAPAIAVDQKSPPGEARGESAGGGGEWRGKWWDRPLARCGFRWRVDPAGEDLDRSAFIEGRAKL